MKGMKGTAKVLFEEKPMKTQLPSVTPQGLAIIGEAGGAEEFLQGKPFVGPSGQKLDQMLEAAGIDRRACMVTNIFLSHPPQNDFKWYFQKEKNENLSVKGFGYVRDEFADEWPRLLRELEENSIKYILALGAKPMQILTGETKISKCRGTIIEVQLGGRDYKVVPTFHPSFILRTGGWNEDVIKDLELVRDLSSGDLSPPKGRTIWVQPTIEDLYEFQHRYLANLKEGDKIAVDIETDYKGNLQIDCIGIAPNEEVAIVVPFFMPGSKTPHYWATLEEEIEAYKWCKKWIEDPRLTKVGQNFMFDMQYMADNGIRTFGNFEDTMFMGYVLEQEKPKDLASLASRYTDEHLPWKTMVKFSGSGKDDS